MALQEKIAFFFFTDGGRAKYQPKESLDCSVRAYAVATQTPYNKSHRLFKDHGRKKRHTTRHSVTRAVLQDYPLDRPKTRQTVNQFIKLYPQGRYIIGIRGHMFALIDGVVHDNQKPRFKAIVQKYWKIS